MNKSDIKYSNQNHSTHLHDLKSVPYITFQKLSAAGVCHAFSTRLGGISEGYLASMNLSFKRGDSEAAVMENHRRFAQAVGYEAEKLVFSDQVHTTKIHKVTKEDCGKGIVRESDLIGIDGLVTDQSGIPLITFYADCVPLYFYDYKRKVVALAHSGWRGTAARMGSCMIDCMKKEYGCFPEDIICAIGPSICQNCYEISQDVAEEFMAEFEKSQCDDFLREDGNGKYHLDLWKANQYVLRDAGILEDNLDVTDLCTCCNPELFFSHRASHGKRGNLAALIML